MKHSFVGGALAAIIVAATALGGTVSAKAALVFDLGEVTSELSATEVARSGSFQPNPILALSKANGYGGFSFDFDFDFATAGGSAATRFTDGDSVTMKLSRTGGALLVSDFNYFASHNGRDFYSGAHLISLANGESAFIGASSVPEEIPAVPEPATVLAGALLLLPFAVSTVRILRKKRTV